MRSNLPSSGNANSEQGTPMMTPAHACEALVIVIAIIVIAFLTEPLDGAIKLSLAHCPPR
jgi:hypothetical protein